VGKKTFVAYIKKLNSKFEARNPKQIQNFENFPSPPPSPQRGEGKGEGVEFRYSNFDGLVKSPKSVTPAKAGVQTLSLRKQGTIQRNWIPVFTGNPGFLLSQE